MTEAEALRLVCERALELAGEYGWAPAMRPHAEKVLTAVRTLLPDQVDAMLADL